MMKTSQKSTLIHFILHILILKEVINMERYIEKMLLAGLGAFTLTKEKAEEMVNYLVEKGEVSKQEQAEFIKKLLEKGKDTRIEIEKIVEKSLANVLDKFNVPTKSDIDALMKKIDGLAKKK